MSEEQPIFERSDEAWAPTGHARGPWDPNLLHGGAPAALLARELERLEPGAGMLLVRVTYDFMGPVPMAPLEVSAAVEKPGSRFQVVTGELRVAGDERTVVRARGVRLRRGHIEEPPPVEAAPVLPWSAGHEITPFGDLKDEGFHPSAVDLRMVAGSRGSGAAAAWFRLLRPVVAGEAPSPLQRVVAAADFGNGISHALPFKDYVFVNCDLSVHLHREARGEWVALDARTAVGPEGTAQAVSVLHDEDGPIGYAAQSLFVDPR